MTEDILLPFDLPAVRRKKVSAAFDGGRITSDGGVMLFAAAEFNTTRPRLLKLGARGYRNGIAWAARLCRRLARRHFDPPRCGGADAERAVNEGLLFAPVPGPNLQRLHPNESKRRNRRLDSSRARHVRLAVPLPSGIAANKSGSHYQGEYDARPGARSRSYSRDCKMP
jgi:hypothetical protein